MKNWSFWLSVILAVIAPVGVYFGVTMADVTTWSALGELIVRAISNPYVVVMMLVALYNALIDPTTRGIKDSTRAMGYTKPQE